MYQPFVSFLIHFRIDVEYHFDRLRKLIPVEIVRQVNAADAIVRRDAADGEYLAHHPSPMVPGDASHDQRGDADCADDVGPDRRPILAAEVRYTGL